MLWFTGVLSGSPAYESTPVPAAPSPAHHARRLCCAAIVCALSRIDRSLACGNALWVELQSERSRDAPATEDSSPCTDMPHVRRDGVAHSEASNCPPAKSSRAVSLACSCATSTRAERSFRLRMARSACSPCTPAVMCMSKDCSHRAQRHTDTTQRACDHANTHLNLGK